MFNKSNPFSQIFYVHPEFQSIHHFLDNPDVIQNQRITYDFNFEFGMDFNKYIMWRGNYLFE
jgi:hypothetical protein